jgi:hypothetical protein
MHSQEISSHTPSSNPIGSNTSLQSIKVKHMFVGSIVIEARIILNSNPIVPTMLCGLAFCKSSYNNHISYTMYDPKKE